MSTPQPRHPRVVPLALSVCLLLASTARAGDPERGKDIYSARCAFCHGLSGKGDGPAGAALRPPPADFTNSDYWKTATPDAMKAVIEDGKPDTAMVPFKATLRANDIDDVLAYLQTFKPKP